MLPALGAPGTPSRDPDRGGRMTGTRRQWLRTSLGLGAALSFIVAVIVLGALALSWRWLGFDEAAV